VAGSPLLVAVCDNAHEELARDRGGTRDSSGPSDLGGPAGAGGSGRRWLHWHIPDPVRVDTDEAFDTAYALITERVDRLAAAVAPPEAVVDVPAAAVQPAG
jgi:protein-tyrosine-phosphatase